MSFETALRQRLKDDAAVASRVGTRIDWTMRPQPTAVSGQPKPPAFPAIVLLVVNDERSQNMSGFNGFRPTRVQVDAYGTTRAEVVSLREAILAALIPAEVVGGTEFLRSFVNNVVDRGENLDTGFVHRDLIDLNIWHD